MNLGHHDFIYKENLSISFPLNTNMPTFSEKQLVDGLKQRKQHVFAYVYDNYAPTLNGIIHRNVQNKECTEDLLQEVFVKIWNSIDSYDSRRGRLYTWMIAVALNHTIDFMRSKNSRVRKKTDSGDIADKQIRDDTFNPDKYDSIGIKKNICRLKPEYVQLINMAYYYGFTQNEISKALSMPLGTVKTKLRTAIIELRKKVL